MTPIDKARELVNKYLQIYDGRVPQAKKCAIICVDEILEAIDWHEFETPNDIIEWWQEVKTEIGN